MALRISTGVVAAMLSGPGLKAALEGSNGFVIDLYTGARPASANDAATGTKLVTLYSDGTSAGLHFAPSLVGTALGKLESENWTGKVLESGTAGWFRVRSKDDAGNATSTTASRLDGTVAVTGSDMIVSNTSLARDSVFSVAELNLEVIGG